MKLFTHNFLTSSAIKGVVKGYPLIIHATKIEMLEPNSEYSHEYARKMAGTLDYPVFVNAAKQIDYAKEIPEELPEGWMEDQTLVRKIYDLIFCLEIVEGELECPETGRRFPIRDSIPNMLLNENEI